MATSSKTLNLSRKFSVLSKNRRIFKNHAHHHTQFLIISKFLPKFFFPPALIKLSNPLQLNDNIQVAKLPANCNSMKNGNEPVTVAGAGYYTTQGHDPDQKVITLRYANMTTISSEKCRSITKLSNTHQLICASVTNNQSAYDGDSGNPFLNSIFVLAY